MMCFLGAQCSQLRVAGGDISARAASWRRYRAQFQRRSMTRERPITHPFALAWRRQLTHEGAVAAARAVEDWFAAARFRRSFEARLSPLDLTLNEWLVLEGARQMIDALCDATSQFQVAERLEMSEMTLSRLMRGLEERGLVSRRDSFESPALRIWVTPRGAELLSRANDVLCAAGSAPRSSIESRGAAE